MFKIIVLLIMTLNSCTKKTDHEVIKIAVPSDIVTLDPHATTDTGSSRIVAQVYNRLIEKDNNGEFIPSLATKWERISPTNWVVTLRSNVLFHNGDIFSTEDAVYSILRMKSIPSYLQDMARNITSVDTISSNQIQINYSKPDIYLPYLLSHNHAGMLNKKYAETHPLDDQAMGTGAYKIKKINRGEYVLLESFDEYFLGKAPTKYIQLYNIPDPLARSVALETKEVDIAYTGVVLTTEDFKTNETLKNISPIDFESSRLYYLGIDFRKKELNNPMLRKIMSESIDRTNIVNVVLEGMGIPMTTIIPPKVLNVSKTKELNNRLDNTFSIERELILGISDQSYTRVAEIIQENLRSIGLETKIQFMEDTALQKMIENGQLDLFITSKISVTLHPDEYLRHMFYSHSTPSVGNKQFYKNEKIDQLLDKAILDPNPNLIYQEIVEELQKDQALIPLFVPVYRYSKWNYIEEFYLDTIFSPRFDKIIKNPH